MIFRKIFTQTIYKVLYYDRIDVSEGIGVNKISASKELILVTISIFQTKDLNFILQWLLWSINIVKIIKNEATNLLGNADMSKKVDLCVRYKKFLYQV